MWWARIKSYQAIAARHQTGNRQKNIQLRNDYQRNLLPFLIFIITANVWLSYETTFKTAN